MNEIYSTAEVADHMGCTETAIRAQKSRKSDLFIEGQHFIKDNNRTLWTPQGVALLKDLMRSENATTPIVASNGNGVAPIVTNDVTPIVTSNGNGVTPSVTTPATQSFTEHLLQPLLDESGRELAKEFYRRLPGVALQHIKRMGSNPTPEEQQIFTDAAATAVTALRNGNTTSKQLEGGDKPTP